MIKKIWVEDRDAYLDTKTSIVYYVDRNHGDACTAYVYTWLPTHVGMKEIHVGDFYDEDAIEGLKTLLYSYC